MYVVLLTHILEISDDLGKYDIRPFDNHESSEDLCLYDNTLWCDTYQLKNVQVSLLVMPFSYHSWQKIILSVGS